MPIFLQIPGVKGESTEAQYAGWIELQSLSFGASNPDVAAGTKPAFDTVVGSKVVDSTSFVLYGLLLSGKAIDTSVIEVTSQKAPSGAQAALYRVSLKKGFIRSITSQVQNSGALTEETIAFVCSQIQWSTSITQTSGQVITPSETGWNVVTNTAL